MTAPSLAYQDAMNGISILYDALSNAENELDKLKNQWVKCSDRLPEIFNHNGLWRSDVVMCFGVEEQGEKNAYFLAHLVHGNCFYNSNGRCEQVTHWQPLPPPPEDE